MGNPYFKFKQFTIQQDRCAMKVCSDSCIFGALISDILGKQRLKDKKVLDIGGGTGLLTLMVEQKTGADITAVEIDPEAAEQMQENFNNSPWKNRLSALTGDILKTKFPHKFDIIISNPPFFQNQLRSDQQNEAMAKHDLGLTLPDLISCIKENLTKEGDFYILLPHSSENEVGKILKEVNLYLFLKVYLHHSDRHPCYRIILGGSKHDKKMVEEDKISIYETSDCYSQRAISLLDVYYLNVK